MERIWELVINLTFVIFNLTLKACDLVTINA